MQPHLDQAECELIERVLAADPGPEAERHLARLRAALPQAAVEHVLHPAQPDPWHGLPDHCLAVIDLLGQRVAVVPQSACRTTADGVIVAAGSLASDAAAATSAGSLGAASAALTATDLAYVVQLGLRVIVIAPDRPNSSRRRFSIARTGEVGLASSPVDLAAGLLRAAAPTWVALFLLAGGARRRGRVQPPADQAAEAVAVYRAALLHRFFLAALRLSPAPSDRALCRSRLRAVDAEIARIGERVDDVIDGLDELMTGDLLRLSFPGPGQFDKYKNGAIAGQA